KTAEEGFKCNLARRRGGAEKDMKPKSLNISSASLRLCAKIPVLFLILKLDSKFKMLVYKDL
ncbi:MAG TPA: hypothetical protein VLG39_10820, partial [Nitrospirota bacterium]|nr:hypothetical protein [Nitrospirota bacterium]